MHMLHTPWNETCRAMCCSFVQFLRGQLIFLIRVGLQLVKKPKALVTTMDRLCGYGMSCAIVAPQAWSLMLRCLLHSPLRRKFSAFPPNNRRTFRIAAMNWPIPMAAISLQPQAVQRVCERVVYTHASLPMRLEKQARLAL